MNIQNLVLDINKKCTQLVTANVGEVNSRLLKISVIDNGVPMDLTGITVYLYAKKADGTKVFNTVKVEDSKQGIVSAEITSQVLVIEGFVKLTLLLTKDKARLASKIFTLKVDETIVDDEALESSNEFKALDLALDKVDEWNGYFKETSGKIEEKYTERLNQVDSQLAHITHNIMILNGDGDESDKLKGIFSSVSNGSRLLFDKRKVITVNKTSAIVIDNKRDLIIEGLNITGESRNVFVIKNGSNNIIFRNCYFKNAAQIILLYDCSNITIENCYFDTTGYGIIQQAGYSSSHVKVLNNTVENMRSDFVECNCESAHSEDWIIKGNQFLGSLDYSVENTATEKRFVGITGVRNVIISDNIVKNCQGDSAIHLEISQGEILIANNIFENCKGYGYVYIMNNGKHTSIVNNRFINNEVGNTTPFIYAAAGGSNFELLINGNTFTGNETQPVALALTNHNNNKIITNNIFKNSQKVMNLFNCNNVIFNSNNIETIEGLIFGEHSSASCSEWVINGNRFRTTSTSIKISDNTNGTNQPQNISIKGNSFNNLVDIVNVKCLIFSNNHGGSDATFNIRRGSRGQEFFVFGNIIKGVGFNPTDNYTLPSIS